MSATRGRERKATGMVMARNIVIIFDWVTLKICLTSMKAESVSQPYALGNLWERRRLVGCSFESFAFKGDCSIGLSWA